MRGAGLVPGASGHPVFEVLAITGGLDVRYRALQHVPALKHPQRLMISDRHQRIVAHRSRLMSSPDTHPES